VKIWEKSEEIWAKCVKTFTELLYVHWFYKNATQNQNADVFLEIMLYLVLFGQVRGNLRKNPSHPQNLPAPTPMSTITNSIQ